MSRVLVLERIVGRAAVESLLERVTTASSGEGAVSLARALAENAVFQAATLPVSATLPRFCRYEPGKAYGDEPAIALAIGARRLRADVVVAIALSDAESYEGGELVIDGAAHRWKGRAGDCVVYPASAVHRVEPVTRGTRIVALLWLESAVRDASRRSLLFELWQAAEALNAVRAPERDVGRVRSSRAELLRMWSEP